ncbi:MAG: sulfatase [Isosphaeraceae bacterium]|nr:sulfatase [Isosphaeraceae bacterium]
MNVIVIACNSLHLGFLGAYGNSWIETPNLDRLASQSVVFDHHFAENLTTLPTRRSWWTGRYGFPDPEAGWTPLRHDEVILPDLLAPCGVRSALISDNPLLREPGQGFGRGFDDVVWIRGHGYDSFIPESDRRAAGVRVEDEPGLRLPPEDDPDHELWRTRWGCFLRNREVLRTRTEEGSCTSRTVSAAIDWLEARRSSADPFCLWIDLFSPHGPWDPPESFRDQYAAVEPDEFELGDEGDLVADEGELGVPDEEVEALMDVPAGVVGDVISEAELLRLRRTYAGTVSFVDHCLGRLFEALDRLGRYDDSLVVFTSDQGEPLGEHGFVRRFRPWMHEELVHTPLMIRMPRAERGGTRFHAIVQTVDLLPTILSALGLPGAERVHGHDLLPLIRGKKKKIRDYACMGMDGEEFAIRTHLWHLVVPMVQDLDEPRGPSLYRKPEDRWEQNDVLHQHQDVADNLELALRRFVESVRNDDLDNPPALRDVARFTS